MGSPRLLVDAVRSYGADREDRLTEVFASALDVSPPLCWLIAQRAGVALKPSRWKIETQWQDRLVDVVMWGFDERDARTITIFVENKYNPTKRLGAYWFDPTQTKRQVAALRRCPGERRLVGIASAVDTARLKGPVETRPYDPRDDGCDQLLSWDEIKRFAFDGGESRGWVEHARTARATAGERMLVEFVRYVEIEENEMGALDQEDVFVLARTARAEERTDRLLEFAAEYVADELGSEISDDEFDSDRYGDNDSRRTWANIPAPANSWPSALKQGTLNMMISGSAYGDDRSVGEPHVYAGLSWNAGRDGRELLRDSPWEAAAKKVGLALVWDDVYCNVYASKPLLEAIADGDALTDQARRLAEWAVTAVRAALALPSPPDADRVPRRSTRSRRRKA